jgi:tetratricopeptide (TPR) repeat protein
LRERIASGGMGVIFRAYDELGEREVAFKRLVVQREPLRAQVTALFKREYHTLVQLAHPGIVEAYDYGVDDGGPYYTMELLSGKDLRAGMPLPMERAGRLLCEIASALALVHARRLVHRDLSPANVLLTDSGRAKLIDFGALASFGRPKQIVGTPAFMAPEALGEGDIDQRADLYSLGALAYWMLTGKRAVRAENWRELAEAWSRDIVPPSQLAPGLPKALDELVLSLLQHDPLARPASAAHVIDRLASIANQPFEEDGPRVAMSYVAYPPLIARAHEVDDFEVQLRDAAEGHGHAIWIEAPQGAGRSALLDHLAWRAQLAGATVLRAQGGVQGSALSLARALVETALRTHPDLRTFCEVRYPSVAQFCLRQGESQTPRARVPQTPASAAEGYAELVSAMQECLLELSRLNPLVLAVDDAQRVDQESLGLLASLAHEARGHGLLLVTTADSAELARGGQALAKLSQLSREVPLASLDEAGITELVTAIFGAVPNATRLSRWLYAHGGGNPQRTMDVLRLLLQRGVVRYQGGLFSLPYDVDTEIGAGALTSIPLARFEALSADARRIAQLLSLEEEALRVPLLSSALRLAGRRLMSAIDELLERGMVSKLDERLAIASRPLRAAVAGALSPELRQGLHLQLAEALLVGKAPVEARIMAGFHLIEGGERDRGADVLASSGVEIAFRSEGIAKAVPALEKALAVYREQGRSDAACMLLLVPLTVAGFYGDPRLSVNYFERTYGALLHLSGTNLAARLGRYLGGKLALLIGLIYSLVLFLLLPGVQRPPHFRQVLLALFGVASAGAAAMTCAYEQEQTLAIGGRLAPFAALGPRSAAAAVRELCRGLGEIMLSLQADCAKRMAQLVERLRHGRISGLDEEVRQQMLLGAVYVRGISEVYAGNPLVLELADELDQSGRAFSRPRAALLRMCHYGFRGEQEAAEEHRRTAEVLALLGGTSWSAMSAMAIRQLLMYQWTRDSVGLRRVVSELQNLVPIAPAIEPHRELGEAYLELLRGRPEAALARYERVLEAPRRHRVVNWQAEQAHRAQALNALGRHADARALCQALVAETRDCDWRMRFIYQPALQELALSEALLGDVAGAAARLDRLLAELEPLGNPLLSGSVRRDRCRVALLARDAAEFECQHAKLVEHFRATRNPCLIQQCEQLASEAVQLGLRSALVALPTQSARPPANDARGGAPGLTTVVEGHTPVTTFVEDIG